MRGRKPKPTELKKLEGNPGKRALNKKEPQPKSVIPRYPAHLPKIAKAEWARISKELNALGLISRIDRAALVAYCQAWADYIEANQKIDEEGAVIVSDKGGVYQNPWVGIKNSALTRLVKISAEFGMTPSSRSRVQAEKPSDEDGMAALLFGTKVKVNK